MPGRVHGIASAGIGLLLLVGVALTPVAASAYFGSLTNGNGILGSGTWLRGPLDLSWDVAQNDDGSWHYAYEFRHLFRDMTHFVLETSNDFSSFDLIRLNGQFGGYDIGLHSVYPDNPNMPDEMYGIRFDDTWGETTHIAFDTYRAPVWGDFYARGAGLGLTTAWNAGFAGGDSDPFAQPQDGSLAFHILVPNGRTTQTDPIPEPSTMILFGTGLLASGLVFRRRR